jgi:hypothetical protein
VPASLREWLPEDHLAWFVVEAVEEMDLDQFYADYRKDGHGPGRLRAVNDRRPAAYAYARGTAPREGSSASARRTSPTG